MLINLVRNDRNHWTEKGTNILLKVFIFPLSTMLEHPQVDWSPPQIPKPFD